jgi:hypothetical protein
MPERGPDPRGYMRGTTSFDPAIEDPQELAQARRVHSKHSQVRILNDRSGAPIHAMPVDGFLRADRRSFCIGLELLVLRKSDRAKFITAQKFPVTEWQIE